MRTKRAACLLLILLTSCAIPAAAPSPEVLGCVQALSAFSAEHIGKVPPHAEIFALCVALEKAKPFSVGFDAAQIIATKF